MNQEWGRFWIAVAIMALAGAIAMNSIATVPLQLGALAQWASAFATVAAVIVALRNTHYTLERAEIRERENKERRDESYTVAVVVISDQLARSLTMMEELLARRPCNASTIKRASNIYAFDALIARMDKIPIHECHEVILIDVLSTLRLVAHNAQVEIDNVIEDDPEVTISVEPEIILLRSARESLKEAFPVIFGHIALEEL